MNGRGWVMNEIRWHRIDGWNRMDGIRRSRMDGIGWVE